jgi:hypothetical protein
VGDWIASSRSLSSGAHSRDPLAPRNDEKMACGIQTNSVQRERPGGAMECFAQFGNDKVGSSAATKQHDGQITKSLSSPWLKNISLNTSGKSVI